MAARPNNMPTSAMTLSPHYGTRGTGTSQLRTAYVMPAKSSPETHQDMEIYPEHDTSDSLNESGVLEKSSSAGLRAMDRLVQDLLASQRSLQDEKRKAEDKDAEISRLKDEVAQLQQRDCKDCEDAKELRRLLAFHKTNGERVSKKFRDLQAANRDLQAQLQATETALEEQTLLLSGLGGCA